MSRKAANSGEAPSRNRITSSSRKAIDKLTIRKREYVEARVSGDNNAAACQKVGISNVSGHKYEKESDVQAAYRELIRAAIPAKRLVSLIKGGTEATMPVYDSKGHKKAERPDWKTRKPYIEMAAEHGAYVEQKMDNKATLISVTVNHVGKRSIKNVTPNQPIIEATAEAV